VKKVVEKYVPHLSNIKNPFELWDIAQNLGGGTGDAYVE
jgi:hypothetical protein